MGVCRGLKGEEISSSHCGGRPPHQVISVFIDFGVIISVIIDFSVIIICVIIDYGVIVISVIIDFEVSLSPVS